MLSCLEKESMYIKRSPSHQRSLDVLIGEISNCTDFRMTGKICYPMVEIIFLTFCASMCNCESYYEIEDFGKDKLPWLRKYLPFENGIPRHDTINRFLSMFEPVEFERLLINWSSHDIRLSSGSVISVDGKRINRSVTIDQQQSKKESGGKQAIHMMNAYIEEFECCLASIHVKEDQGENQALASILDLLDLAGCIISQDAAGCYQKNVEKIISSKADYVIGLKANQRKIYEQTINLFNTQAVHSEYESGLELKRGRTEKRSYKVLYLNRLDSSADELLDLTENWQNLRTIIKVDSQRKENKKSEMAFFQRYYISSLECSAEQLSKIIRSHWKIENKLHWILDAVLNEDSGRKRKGNAAQNYSNIRKMALNQIRKIDDPSVGIKRRQMKCARNPQYLDDALNI